MAEIMDPFAYDLLARPLPPPGFDHFCCGGCVMSADVTIEQVDDYLRAIGALPPRPPADDEEEFPSPAATFRLRFAVDRASDLPATSELHAPASDNNSAAATALANPAAAYDVEIDASLRATEKDPTERPSPDYLATTQGGRVDAAARAALVQWMRDFSGLYCLDDDDAILHRAVSYVDRFLSARALPAEDAGDKNRLRLVGAVALHVAAKFEDPSAARDLKARDIACWCGYDATHADVLATERAMVASLRYRLGGPTANTFVDHFITRSRRHSQQGSEEDVAELRRVARLVADVSLFDYGCLKLLPSAVAAAAIFLERLLLTPSCNGNREQVRRWGRELEEMTGYRPAGVRDGVVGLHRLIMPTPGFVLLPMFFADF
ncbi:hypothetical protein EJB05_20966, partial [Eragrostis curvula]